MEPEFDGVATKDIAQPIAADNHKLQADFLGDRLQPGRAHLPRGADAEPISGDDEVLSPMDALTEIRHQVAKGADLPPFIEAIKTFGDAVVRGECLVGIDRVQLFPGCLRVPED